MTGPEDSGVEPPGEVTRLLGRIDDPEASSALAELLYGQLRTLAGRLMDDQGAGHTLQPTALVNEAWMRLVGPAARQDWDGRRQFLRFAAQAMRSVLVDHARASKAVKRGGGAARLPLDALLLEAESRVGDLSAFDEAVTRLEAVDPELARVVELRFFAGLSMAETAKALELSVPTVERRWRTARMFLRRSLDEPG